MTEDQLVAGLRDALELTGWIYVHLGGDQRGVYRGDPGFPDLFGIAPDGSRGIAWECKADTGRVSPDQAGWIALLRALATSRIDGADHRPALDVRVVRPADYDACLRYILEGRPVEGLT